MNKKIEVNVEMLMNYINYHSCDLKYSHGCENKDITIELSYPVVEALCEDLNRNGFLISDVKVLLGHRVILNYDQNVNFVCIGYERGHDYRKATIAYINNWRIA